MQLTFLGTSSGTPTRQRNVSALALAPERQPGWVLIDCGEATQHQLLHLSLSPQKLDLILITHMHGDHCYGLPGLLASMQLNGRQAPLVLVGPAQLAEYLQSVIRLTDMQLSYPLEFIDAAQLLGQPQVLAGVQVEAASLSHRVLTYGYKISEQAVPLRLRQDRLAAAAVPRGPLWGQLQQGLDIQLEGGRGVASADMTEPAWQARSVVVAGDNDTPQCLAALCAGADLLVHEATYDQTTAARIGPAPQHSDAHRVARFAQQLKLPALVLTHFSARYGPDSETGIGVLEREALTEYQGQLFMAQDGAQLEIGRQRRYVWHPCVWR